MVVLQPEFKYSHKDSAISAGFSSLHIMDSCTLWNVPAALEVLEVMQFGEFVDLTLFCTTQGSLGHKFEFF